MTRSYPRRVREGRFIREAIETAVVRKAAVRAHDPSAAEDAMRHHLREILVSLGPIAERNPAWFEADEPERVPLSS
ncbi:DNA-binding GntR family transcriptional regulator [Paraburkholderia sp. CI3]